MSPISITSPTAITYTTRDALPLYLQPFAESCNASGSGEFTVLNLAAVGQALANFAELQRNVQHVIQTSAHGYDEALGRTYPVAMTPPGTDESGTPKGAALLEALCALDVRPDGYSYAAFGPATRDELKNLRTRIATNVPPYIERALVSLAKAWPILSEHARHIDGEFDNALHTVRRYIQRTALPAAESANAKPGDTLNPTTLEEALAELRMAQKDHLGACKTIVAMHTAAMGEACPPTRGLVEDVADLRARYLKALQEVVNANVKYEHACEAAINTRQRSVAWEALYRRAINEANALHNFVEESPALRRSEKRLAVLQEEAALVGSDNVPTLTTHTTENATHVG